MQRTGARGYQGTVVPSQDRNWPVGPSSGSSARRTAPAAPSAGSPARDEARPLGPFRSVRRAPGASAFTLKPSSARALAYSTVSSFSAVLDDRYAPWAPDGLLAKTMMPSASPMEAASEAVPLEMFTIL